MDMKKFSDLK